MSGRYNIKMGCMTSQGPEQQQPGCTWLLCLMLLCMCLPCCPPSSCPCTYIQAVDTGGPGLDEMPPEHKYIAPPPAPTQPPFACASAAGVMMAAQDGAEPGDEVSVLIWPGGTIEHWPRGTTVAQVVRAKVRDGRKAACTGCSSRDRESANAGSA